MFGSPAEHPEAFGAADHQTLCSPFPPEAVDAVKAANLDVVVRCGFNILRGDILNSARYGVWSFHHGDNDFYRGGPAFFWEVYEDNPLSGVILQVLNEQLDAGFVLCKGIFSTVRGLSHARNVVRPYWDAQTFLIQKLWELHQRGWEAWSATRSHPRRTRDCGKPTALLRIGTC